MIVHESYNFHVRAKPTYQKLTQITHKTSVFDSGVMM